MLLGGTEEWSSCQPQRKANVWKYSAAISGFLPQSYCNLQYYVSVRPQFGKFRSMRPREQNQAGCERERKDKTLAV